VVDEVLQGIEKAGSRLHKEYELEFYFALACVHFGAGQMNKSLFWLNKVLNDNEPTLRQDIFTYARLFNLIVHYELGNNDLLEYIVRSTQRFLTKRQRAHEVESMLIENIRKLARTSDPVAKKEIFRSMYDRAIELFKDPNEGLVLKYFDVLAWLKSHLQGETFADTVNKAGAGEAVA